MRHQGHQTSEWVHYFIPWHRFVPSFVWC